MGRCATGLPALWLRLLLSILLVLSPLGHGLSGAAASPAPVQPGPHCHQQDDAGPAHDKTCCHHPGGTCHCVAATAALPATPMSCLGTAEGSEPVDRPAFVLHIPIVPDPPPPRR